MFTVSLIFLFNLLVFIFIFHVGWFDEKSHAHLANEEIFTVAENNTVTGYELNVIDNYHISETKEIFIQESSSDSRPSNLHDLEIDDHQIGRALSSPLFHEREDPATRRRVYQSTDEILSSSQSSTIDHVGTGRPVFDEFPNARENPRLDSESEQTRVFLEQPKEHTSADYRVEIRGHEFQADYDDGQPETRPLT